ncbi:hypothetical protein J6O86_04625 [bacterium]|nr:hypothetical protein [bacterium]
MPKIVKLGNVKLCCFTPHEVDKIPNVPLGKNCRVNTNNILKKDPRLNQFFNNETMGALDNYAEHENLRIYIKPLENDMFNDVAISVYKDHDTKAYFPMNVAKTKEEVPQFFRDLYTKIHNATHKSVESKLAPKTKHSKWTDAKMYFENVVERYNEKRLSILDKFND